MSLAYFRSLKALASAGVTVSLAVSLVSMGTGSASATVAPVRSGAYVGGIAVQAATDFATYRGRPMDIVSDFLPGGSWADIEMPSWFNGTWAYLPQRPTMALGVPLLATDADSLATGATGAYDAHFAELARRLVSAGMADSVLRLGWEMNGGWYRWAAKGHETEFKAYWRHIVTTMRAVTGAHFDFDFNPTLGPGAWGATPDLMYPGDDVVDSIGLDVYDSVWGQAGMDPAVRWNGIVGGTYGLNWWASFAAAHGNKPLNLPEWGLVNTTAQNGGGGGDDPVFMSNLLTWIRSHNVGYESYFEFDAPDCAHKLEIGAYPESAALYRTYVQSGATTTTTTTATVSPTATATVSPTATATVSPTATATVRPTATATSTATASPTPTATSTVKHWHFRTYQAGTRRSTSRYPGTRLPLKMRLRMVSY